MFSCMHRACFSTWSYVCVHTDVYTDTALPLCMCVCVWQDEGKGHTLWASHSSSVHPSVQIGCPHYMNMWLDFGGGGGGWLTGVTSVFGCVRNICVPFSAVMLGHCPLMRFRASVPAPGDRQKGGPLPEEILDVRVKGEGLGKIYDQIGRAHV